MFFVFFHSPSKYCSCFFLYLRSHDEVDGCYFVYSYFVNIVKIIGTSLCHFSNLMSVLFGFSVFLG